MSSMTEAHVRTLSNGQDIPLLALGMWQVPDGPTAENAVRWALELGYRHIDTAQVYGNEPSVGPTPAQVLVRWCLQRDTVVLTKSTHRDRTRENATVFHFVLSDEHMSTLDGLDRTGGTDEPLERRWW